MLSTKCMLVWKEWKRIHELWNQRNCECNQLGPATLSIRFLSRTNKDSDYFLLTRFSDIYEDISIETSSIYSLETKFMQLLISELNESCQSILANVDEWFDESLSIKNTVLEAMRLIGDEHGINSSND